MGTVELVINLGSGRSSESGISGPHSRSFIIERTFRDQLLGVHFKLGGAFPFLGFPFGDLHNLGIRATYPGIHGRDARATLASWHGRPGHDKET